jgi:hypothetical protein
MKGLNSGSRILALDVHPQSYGYAVLETPANLLDWGVRRGYRPRESKRPPSMQGGLRTLLEIWRPSLVVVSEPSRHWTVRTRKRWADLLKEVRRLRIPVRRLTTWAVRNAFDERRRLTKYLIASMLVMQFPFLAATLPPPRKIWKSEDYRMGIFGAVALAIAGCGPKHGGNH